MARSARLRWIAAVVGVALIAGGPACWQGWLALNEPLVIAHAGTTIEVVPGTSLSSLADDLAREGIVTRPRLLAWYGRLTGSATRIQAGEYRLTSDLTPLTLLEKLASGDVVMHQLTIVEGWRFETLLDAVRNHPAVTAGTQSPDVIMRQLGLEGIHPEGQFLPDTYAFPKGATDLEILARAHAALEAVLDAAWEARLESAALDTPYQALVLASIIEKETALVAERPLIAGVLHERLRIGMRLQVDPTVIYGLGDEFDGNLRRRDLEADTPYNTYTRYGLPPTPIALPSRSSIMAAVQPEITGALYFVATGEPDGSHRFSRTTEEHNQAVRDYLSRQRNRERAQ